MKYVTRAAPLPPRSQELSNNNSNHITNNKPKPPRPPPPRANIDSKPAVKEQSMKLFSNLFGATKKSSNKSNEKLSQAEVKLPPPRIPPPVTQNIQRYNQNFTSSSTVPVQQISNDLQLINFDESPPASPAGFIKKSNTGGSDSVSMDSFCSSNSSPNNFGLNSGTTSQAESGFEDDFSVSDFKISSRATSTTFSNDPFDCLDEFSSTSQATNLPVKNIHANIRNMKPLIQPKPIISIGNTNFYTTNPLSNSPSPANFEETLSNGKNLMKQPVVSMPTIIKPVSSANGRKPSPTQVPLLLNNEIPKKKNMAPLPPATYRPIDSASDDSFEDESSSPPMPTIPAPILVISENNVDYEEKDSYGIALYDYESDVTEDLSFHANEKIYLLQQMNDEWMYGRNKRGCEGIFPISYVEIKVPLKNPQTDSGTESRSESVSPIVSNTTGNNSNKVRVLYTFNAETEEDLTLIENEYVNVIYKINSDWLYGSNSFGQYGQFPSTFIDFIPQNLPLMPK